jgi:hypothetical protein
MGMLEDSMSIISQKCGCYFTDKKRFPCADHAEVSLLESLGGVNDVVRGIDSQFRPITDKLANLLSKKRRAYGPNNLTGAGDFFSILYPNGIKPEQYRYALILARMFDKMSRIATGLDGEEDAWQDLAGYAICAMQYRDELSVKSRDLLP